MPRDHAPRRSRSATGLIVVIAVAAAIIGWAVITSPLFDVRRIQVVGNVALTSEDVVRLSGIGEGDNLFAVAPGRVEERIRRSPWVAAVAVRRSFPSTVVLRITERRPVATIRDPGGPTLLGADGTVLGRGGGVVSRVPSLGDWPHRLEAGARLPASDVRLRVVGSFPPRLRRAVAAVNLSDGDVVLRLRPRGRVLYGRGTSLQEKNQAILSMLRWAEERDVGVGRIDVRVPDSPALRPAGERPPEHSVSG